MLTRRCDNPDCHAVIDEPTFLELSARVLKSDGKEQQDALRDAEGHTGESYGDYCRVCIEDGSAIDDILADLVKRKVWSRAKPPVKRSTIRPTAKSQ